MSKIQQDLERYYELNGSNIKGISAFLLAIFNYRIYPVFFYRISCFFFKIKLGFFANIFSFLNLIFFGIETSPKVEIGGGLFLPHTIGTILGAEKIGKNVTIMHDVTIGAREMDFHFNPNSRPLIGNNVFIGSGAKILGNVKIGNNSQIGSNSVVLTDVPAGCLAIGIPAKIIKKNH